MASNPISNSNKNRNPRTYTRNRSATRVQRSPTHFMRSESTPRQLPTQSISIHNSPVSFQASGLSSSHIIDALKCPKCNQMMQLPIYMCVSGHNLCHVCHLQSNSKICPICLSSMSTQRNYTLEELSRKLSIDCSNVKLGCGFKGQRASVAQHEETCQFRPYICPVKKFDNSCTWQGNISQIEDHFRKNHSRYTTLSPGHQVTFTNVDVNMVDKNIQLFTYQNQLFVYHVLICPVTKAIYWTIQYLGSDVGAENWRYEVQVYNTNMRNRKITIMEGCPPYSANVEHLFSSGKCASLPIKVMESYMNSSRDFTFKFYMRNNERDS